MPWGAFLAWNELGGVTWAATVAVAGYPFGVAAGAVIASANVLLLVLALAAAWRDRRR